jgi:hypothetical protein
MVVVMKEAEWLESEVGITISLQMRGASLATVDLVQTDTYIKVGPDSEDFFISGTAQREALHFNPGF